MYHETLQAFRTAMSGTKPHKDNNEGFSLDVFIKCSGFSCCPRAGQPVCFSLFLVGHLVASVAYDWLPGLRWLVLGLVHIIHA